MSTHIGAAPGEIAPHVLMPGDPLRAKWIAETFLEDASCYNEVRGMLGYTGTWKGQRVTVQGSGMGQPSFAIYANELFTDYDVQSMIRVGVLRRADREGRRARRHPRVGRLHRLRDEPAALPRPRLRPGRGLRAAPGGVRRGTGSRRRDRVDQGLIFSGDQFYTPRPELMAPMVEHGVLAAEMEASALYTLAAKYGRRALAICTVSDHIVTGEETTALEREERSPRWSRSPEARSRHVGRDRPVDRRGRAPANQAPHPPGAAPRQVSERDQPLQLGPLRQAVGLDHLRCARSRTPPAPARPARRQLGPRDPVDRELERVGGRGAVGLPVHEQVARLPVGLGVDRVDPAADHLAAEHQRERRLHGVRHPVGERPVLEGA